MTLVALAFGLALFGSPAPSLAGAPAEEDEEPAAEVEKTALVVRVTDFASSPIDGAVVRVLDGETVVAEEAVDDRGEVSFEELPRQDLRLVASAAGHLAADGVVHAADVDRYFDPDRGPTGFLREWTPAPEPGRDRLVVRVVLTTLTDVEVHGAPPGARVVGLAVSTPLEIRDDENVNMYVHTQGEEHLIARVEATADEAGDCVLEGVPAETTLVARAELAGRAVHAVAVPVGGRGSRAVQLRRALPAWTLTGSVVAADETPVAGARVVVAPVDAPGVLCHPERPPESSGRNRDDVALAWIAETSADGTYQIPHLMPGVVYAALAEDGEGRRCAVTWDIAESDGDGDTRIDFVVDATITLQARFSDQEGMPTERGRVRIRTLPRDDGAERQVWIEDGYAECEGLPRGRYALYVEGRGVLPTDREILLTRSSGVLEVQVDAGAVISGRVEDLEGQPVVDALVQAFDPDVEAQQVIRTPYGEQGTVTGADGTFRLSGLSPRLWNVRVNVSEDIAAIVAPTEAPARDLVLRVGPHPRLRFGIAWPEGASLREVRLGVFRLVGDGTPYAAGGWDPDAITETTVGFQGLPADQDVIVRFVVPGHPPFMRSFRLAPGENRDLGVLEPPVGVEVKGVVRDSQGAPLAGVEVNAELREAQDVETDENGVFRLDNVAPGEQRIFASRFRFDSAGVHTGEVITTIPSPDAVEIVALHHPDASGTVSGPDGAPIAAEVRFIAVRPWGRLRRPVVTESRRSGSFDISLEPGRYRVYVIARGSDRPVLAQIVEIAEEPEEPLKLELPAPE